jgi:hypothetical protein
MRRSFDLLNILRETLRSLEVSEEANSPAFEELKRSVLRSIAELEQARSEQAEKCA